MRTGLCIKNNPCIHNLARYSGICVYKIIKSGCHRHSLKGLVINCAQFHVKHGAQHTPSIDAHENVVQCMIVHTTVLYYTEHYSIQQYDLYIQGHKKP